MQANTQPIRFADFIHRVNVYFMLIGIQPLRLAADWKRSYLLDAWFAANIVNMNAVLLSETVYVLLAIATGTHFLEATMNLAYIGFVAVADIKIISILRKKGQLLALLRQMEAIFPAGRVEQKLYQVDPVYNNYRHTTFIFALMHLVLIWSFNLYIVVSYFIYDFLLGVRRVELTLPYYCWIPWQWRDHWSYYPLYASLDLAGHTCMCGTLACDIVLCAVVAQLIMHFKYVAKRMKVFEAKGSGAQGDFEFLRSIIEYHQKILSLSDDMNKVFGVSLLLNFVSSTFIMCFLSFQTTIGAATDFLIMLLLFLSCSLFQVYMIANYGQQLILASESVGDAVYQHDWHQADSKYRKMLVLIVGRSQKPTILKATDYLNISRGTVTEVLQISYKFFALLRTIYSK